MTAKATGILFFCLLLLLPEVSQADNELPCDLRKVLHVGTASQGKDAKYAIQYQSAGGDGCRLYRVRNVPGHPSTSVVWKTTNEILMDVQLSACPTNTVCSWMITKKIGEEADTGSSTLAYGKTGDYSQAAEAIIAKAATPSPGQFPEYRTSLQGVIADSRGNATEIGIEVSSKVEGTGPYRLTYRLSLMRATPQVAGPRRQVVGRARQLAILSPLVKRQDLENLSVAWVGVTEGFSHGSLGQRTILALSEESPEAAITISAKAVTLRPVALIVRSGRQQVAMTSAPAYFPINPVK